MRVGLWRKPSVEELMLLNCGVGGDFWESLGLQGDPTSPSCSVLDIHPKNWCWSWNSNTLATWCEELTHLKRPWCWERLKAWAEGDGRGWDGWLASPTQWTWVWVNSGNWWWTGRPGVLPYMGSQRAGHDGATELNWSFRIRLKLRILPDSAQGNYWTLHTKELKFRKNWGCGAPWSPCVCGSAHSRTRRSWRLRKGAAQPRPGWDPRLLRTRPLFSCAFFHGHVRRLE